ncbi:MAG: septum site-determining protein MinC [Zoogloea sp.]|nr:septum site-determining protein MinC [Zoogloea sp.]
MSDTAQPGSPIEFQGASLSVMTAFLRDADPVRLADALHTRLGGMADFFSGEAAVLDCAQLRNIPARIDWTAIVSLLRRYQLQPVAVRNLPESLLAGAQRAGLAIVDAQAMSGRAEQKPAQRAAPAPAPAAAPAPAPAPVIMAAAQTLTMVIDRPLRSGQQIYAKGGDLVLLAGVSNGAEVIADGSIHCYGPLRGRALAGAKGETKARIFSTNFGPELVSIAGVYRTFERGIPEPYAGRVTQVRLGVDGSKQSLEISALQTD